jgi:hypothetical protein
MKTTFRDKQYQTLEACYKANKDIAKVSFRVFTNRLRHGLSVEEALTKPPDSRNRSFRGSHTVEGVEYINLPSIARAYGITEWVVYRRYCDEFRGDELVPLKKRKSYVPPPPPEPKKPKHQIEIGGVTYKSIRAACRALGIKLHTYKNRRRIGCPLEQCLGIEPYKRRRKTYEIDGERLVIEEIEERFGITSNALYYRLRKGLTLKEALAKKPSKRRKSKVSKIPD